MKVVDVDIDRIIIISVYLNEHLQSLFFLGSICKVMIKTTVGMQMLSELLFTDPDIANERHASKLLLKYETHRNGIPIEFKIASFTYADKIAGSELINASFVISAVATTAIVRNTGVGKITTSCL